MRAHHSRRNVQLAAALIAAGLCLSAAPHALAADEGAGSAMKLSSARARTLAAHATLDAYGDADASRISPKAEDTPEANGAGPAAGGDGKVTFTGTSTLEGVQGMGATVPVGKKGDYFTVNSLGAVQRHAADGSAVWARTNASFYADWQVKPSRVYQSEPYPARILMGYNAVSPFSPTSDSGYSTGDLTGDGTADLVLSAGVGSVPYRPFTSPGSSLPTGTFVTVVDGRTGRTLWSKLYDNASMVKIVDGTLLVADAPRMNMNAPAADTAKLSGIRFSYAGGALTPSTTWTYDTEEAGDVNWGDIQELGGGSAAVSWDLAKAAGAAGRGRTLVLDTDDGSVSWQTDSMLYSRQIRLDAGRKRIVAVEQADATDGVRYEIASYDLRTGRRSTLDSRVNVLPTALTIGDLGAGAGDEYAVAESSLDNDLYVNAGTVRALNGDDPAKVLWSHTVKRDSGNADDGASIWRLQVAGGRLITSAQDDEKISTSQNPGGSSLATLTVFSGKGQVAWEEKGPGASPMYQDVFSDARGAHVRVIDQGENIRTYKLANGKQQQVTPLQGDISSARAADLDKDGKSDVVMGGSSNGVWAYSGPSLAAGKPEKLWQATVPGAVHDIETGDVDGDGRPEIVVAADSAVAVLNGRTGKTLATISGGGQFVHSAKVADLDGDGKADILVATNALNAYHGDGHKLWSYTAPKALGDVVFSDPSVNDGRVYTSYSKADSLEQADPAADAVALNARTGRSDWDVAPKAPAVSSDGIIHAAITYNGTFASKEIPYADGHAVVYMWDIQAQAGVGSADSDAPHDYMEIRDGRTGEVLHSGTAGGLWTHGGFWADNGTLYQAGTSSYRSYGADGDDHMALVIPQSYTGGFATGPGGRKLLVGGVEGGVESWDPDIIANDSVYPDSVGEAGLMGGRNFLTADLDGDGVDEALSLNGDDSGPDRIAENLGGRYLVQDNAIHQVTAYKLS
ncbi:FG-GAP repeat domain-containing protein [Streptomyces sp. NBC_00859]|uniref:FG-GAP repeat domain-containing protein n=1 Tax=Streptomyces sp. NBC_00859 TaxID=2903682 RepID=UPI003865E199|nr:VCBS repeat-containing protein [Streptomyces sp. NBC_00859]